MSSLSDFTQSKASGPYQSGLKVKVVAVNEEVKYKAKDGKEKGLVVSAVSDGVEIVKCVVYDNSQFQRFKVGNILILRNIIRKREESVSLVVTSASKVFLSSSLVVPDEHADRGRQIINPPPAPEMRIREALNSPPKKRVSIKGKITQEEETTIVVVRGEEVPIKTITLEDESGSSKVTLWRDMSKTECRPGHHVLLTDVVVNHYQNVTNFQTTNPSKITKVETPEECKEYTIEAIGVANGIAELLALDGQCITVPAELLNQAVPNFEEKIKDGAIDLKISSKGAEVLSIDRI